MKKQQRRKSLKTQSSNPSNDNAMENAGPSNVSPVSFVQAKPSFSTLTVDLSGTWKTCGENIDLSRSAEPDTFEGKWGVHVMKFKVDGDSIPSPYLGTIALMFDGTVPNQNKIQWGNGQVWTRL